MFRGTNVLQDGRFKNKTKLAMETLQFPPEFKEKINMTKIEMKVIRSWVENKIIAILGFEDEFLSNYIMSMLEDKSQLSEPKNIYLNLTCFLDKNTFSFMTELWNLLLSAQKSENGIPEQLIKEKKEEIKKDNINKQTKIKFLETMLGDDHELNSKNKVEIKEPENEKAIIKDSLKQELKKYEEIYRDKNKKHKRKKSYSSSSSYSRSRSRKKSKHKHHL